MKKTWTDPKIVNLNNQAVQSANMQTMPYYEAVTFTLQNTCTDGAGGDCAMGDGVVYYTSVSSGFSISAFNPGSPGTFAAGVTSFCPGGPFQCS